MQCPFLCTSGIQMTQSGSMLPALLCKALIAKDLSMMPRRIYRIRLSDKTSRLHPRRAATKLGQAYEPEVLVKVRKWISSALASPDFVLEAQPPAQPHSCVVVEHPIRFAGCSNTKVIGPSAKRAVQLLYQPCGLLPSSRSDGQRMDSVDHALEALL